MNQTTLEKTDSDIAGAGAQRTQQMLSAPVLPLLLKMASPNAVAFLIQSTVSMTEVWYVGQLGTVSLAAMALMFPWLMLMQMLSNGAMGGGVTGAVARAVGANEVATAERLIWHSLTIAIVVGFGFLGIVLLAMEPLLSLMSSDVEVLAEARLYAVILFSGCPLIWSTALMSSVYRGMGNMKFPASLMVLGAVIQIPLSGTLILGWFGVPSLGIAGAAVSVLVVSATSTILLLVGLRRRKSLLQLRWSMRSSQRDLYAAILRVGLPSSISPILTVSTLSGLNILVGSFGVAALAGYGIGSRVEFLVIPLVFGLGVSMNALVGVNLGAGKVKRAVRIGWTGAAVSFVLTGIGGLAVAIWPEAWAGLFTQDAETLASAKAYLQYVGPFFAFQGMGLSLFFASQGAGAMTWPLIATAMRLVVAIGGGVILLYVFDSSLEFIYLASGLAMIVVGVMTASALKLGMWERNN
ncbi:MAG: putative MATE family efflux protein [Candidatus Azotimanducaceae bacterium]|jgi:putative MATE family efflux protein